jgi:hypothetical protein
MADLVAALGDKEYGESRSATVSLTQLAFAPGFALEFVRRRWPYFQLVQLMEGGMTAQDIAQIIPVTTAEDQLDPLMVAERWMLDGREVAVATVIETWGSAPRPVGSHLVIDAQRAISADRYPAAASRAR